MDPIVRGLTWPVIGLLIVGGSHLGAEAVRPALRDLLTPPALIPFYLAAGAWAGSATVRAGGTFVHGILAGALLGLLPVILQVVGFGLLLGRDGDSVTSAAFVGAFAIFWGGVLGSGFAQGRTATAGT
jgi:hypothetical protein